MIKLPPDESLLKLGKNALEIEAEAILTIAARLDQSFVAAIDLIWHGVIKGQGRLIVSGIGKSGHIARKIASTMSSTGTPTYFVHAAEASHGDLGMIKSEDILLALSYSGESEDLLRILPLIRRRGGKIISITGNSNSSLAREADVHLNSAVIREACPLNLAPTASSTAALALGDALAVTLLQIQGFNEDDFARSHPGGTLGRRLLTHVSDVMRARELCPTVFADCPLSEAIITMSRGGLGMVIIVDAEDQVLGVFTDGDLRRAFAKDLTLLRAGAIGELMQRHPQTISSEQLAVAAVDKMQKHHISQLIVVNQQRLQGALNMHDLFQAGIL